MDAPGRQGSRKGISRRACRALLRSNWLRSALQCWLIAHATWPVSSCYSRGLQDFCVSLTSSQGSCNRPRHVCVRHVACEHCSWPGWEPGEFKFCLSSFLSLVYFMPSLAISRDFAALYQVPSRSSRLALGLVAAGCSAGGSLWGGRADHSLHRIASYLPSPTSSSFPPRLKNLLSRILSSLLPMQLSASPSHLSSPYRHI